MKSSSRLNAVMAMAAGLAAIGGAAPASAQSQPATAYFGERLVQLDLGLYPLDNPVALERAQYFWGGRRYCWYDGGWRGPGYYWCGYAHRRGFGWGGPVGWRGWGHGGYGGGHGFHGGRGYGGHGGGHDLGGRGGGHGGGHAGGHGGGDHHH